MKKMNEIINETQEQLEVVTGRLSYILSVKDKAAQLDDKTAIFMGDPFGTLELAMRCLDKFTFTLIDDLNTVIEDALEAIEDAEEWELEQDQEPEPEPLPEAGQDQKGGAE